MFYYFARWVVSIILKLFNRWEIEGQENLPATGPAVIAVNHVSYWDPPVVGCSVKRMVHFMAKEELFHIPLFKYIIRNLECFPVRRGQADRNALRLALKYLKEGEVVGIFPEGTRSKSSEMLPFGEGTSLIALKGGAPIVPMALIGTRKAFPASWRGHIIARIGKPLIYPELYGAKISNEDLKRVNADLTNAIKTMLES